MSRQPLTSLVITDSWTVGELQTVDDHDVAAATLSRDIAAVQAKIEAEIEAQQAGEPGRGSDWLRRAKAAVRIKKSIIEIVAKRRDDLANGSAAGAGAAALVERFRSELPSEVFRRIACGVSEAGGEA